MFTFFLNSSTTPIFNQKRNKYTGYCKSKLIHEKRYIDYLLYQLCYNKISLLSLYAKFIIMYCDTFVILLVL